ncbi:restriction endonuclease [Empedobacter brevis]|uniref:Restriction endonuclease n=1 Tax=Empedobacter brevis TaxID=247 RepID=A0AAJ1QB92_9FLAO|nr:restriction endonuclease [Empedobacter brevis]MDM1070903.1 restriction endonuclease [Empedobacter brevis]
MKTGKEYELLIEQLYKSLEPNALVTHDDQIYDERAKTTRQIDVSIKYKFAGVEHLIIVQAKDYKHKANITVVDQFQQVIEDTNANKGILICSKGFSKTALVKAKSYGIECLTVYSALNKKWETLLKIPVYKTIYEFGVKWDFMLHVAHLVGKQITFLQKTFSYDGYNVINLSDIIYDKIIKLKGIPYIKKMGKVYLNLSELGIYHSFGDEMLPIENGFIELDFIKSSKKRFYLEPTNYLYVFDHINERKELHNLTISEETLDSLLDDKYLNDIEMVDDPIIITNLYKYNEEDYSLDFKFNVNGAIEGGFFVKDNRILKIDERNKSIVELERILKNKGAV